MVNSEPQPGSDIEGMAKELRVFDYTTVQAFLQRDGVKSLLALVAVALLNLLMVAFLLRGPWSISTVIGGPADSPWVGEGFYTKEAGPDGVYRWAGATSTLRLPSVANSYLISVEASKGPLTQTQRLTILENGLPVTHFDLTPGFRTYSFYWRPSLPRQWFLLSGSLDLTLEAQARHVGSGDTRALAVVVHSFSASAVGGLSLAPFAWVLLTLFAAWLLFRSQVRGLFIFAALSTGLTLLYIFLTWRPLLPSSVWMPVPTLPSLATLALWGVALARWRPTTPPRAAIPVVLVGCLAIALLGSITVQWDLSGPDYAWHLNHGSTAERVFQAHDFYPFGFPLILWLGTTLFNNALFAGRLAAFIALSVAFGLTLAMAWRLSGARAALLVGLLLLASPVFLAYGAIASTDVIQLLPTSGVFALLLWNRELSRRRVFWAGVLLGVSYLARYQAMVFLPLVGAWLLFQPSLSARWRQSLRLKRWAFLYAALLFAGGFVAGSSPQWLLDVRDTGLPYHSRQYENIWQAAFGRTDAVVNASKDLEAADESAPSNGGLWDILSFDPYTLARHWAGNLRDFFANTIHLLFVWPIGLTILLAIALALMRGSEPRVYLLLLASLGYITVIALTWNKDRFYLPIIPLLAVLGAWFISGLGSRTITLWRWQLSLGDVAQALVLFWVLQHLGALESILPTYGTLQ